MRRQHVQQLVAETKSTLQQLDQAASQEPTRGLVGDALREALNPENQAALESKLNDAARASQGPAQQQAAGEAKEGLQAVSNAFEQSLPAPLQLAMQGDALKPGDRSSAERGMAQMEQLNQRLQEGQPSRLDNQLWREALLNLRRAWSNKGSGNENPSAVAVLVEEALQDGDPVTLERLRQLLDELRKFSAELKHSAEPEPEEVEITNIDPLRLPPAYRERIERYYRKLSEMK
jgi:uncharacterized membrane protein YdfJ with MMPL/SSD domain